MKEPISKAEFEINYDDGSGVEYRVTYERKPYLHDKEIIGSINIKHGDDIDIPANKVQWLIQCLVQIRDEIN